MLLASCLWAQMPAAIPDASGNWQIEPFTDSGGAVNDSLATIVLPAGVTMAAMQIETQSPWQGCNSPATVILKDPGGNVLDTVDTSQAYEASVASNGFAWMQGVVKPLATPVAGTVLLWFSSPAGCAAWATGIAVTLLQVAP
jgi:hypothetical protein